MAGHPNDRHRDIPALTAAFVLVVGFMLVEFAGALIGGSLALLSDAGHMATDALGLGMALAASAVSGRMSGGSRRTYGLYRLEILAALANAVLLVVVGAYVVYEAVRRFGDPPSVATTSIGLIAAAGLVVNLIAWRILTRAGGSSLNFEGALLEVAADLVGSVAVVAGAVVMAFTEWYVLDPIIGVAIGVYVLPRAARLGRAALDVLVQAAPPGVDLDLIRSELGRIAGVVDVHDLHVWSLTSDMEVATAHLMTSEASDPHSVLDEARAILEARHGISHATLQIEPESHTRCDELGW